MQKKVKLIQQTYTRNSSGDYIATETEREVWARTADLTGAAWAEAGQRGINASMSLYMPIVNYHGEKIASVDGIRYAVYRTYHGEDADDIQLYLEEEVGVTDA